MKHRLLSVSSIIALVTVLLCLLVGAGTSICCTGPTTYTLTMASTTGGSVTPAVGTHSYDAGTAVPLTATADIGYSFANWTGGGADIDDADAATTTITMNADHSITANFVSQQYTLTISSTDGGDVTSPAEGTHTYDAGMVVGLVATADANYHFVNWTGGGTDIDDANAATTNITMNADHTVTANFGFDMTFIEGVPDTNQPPTQTLVSTANPTNYCAPMAAVNVLGYWDAVVGDANAQNLTAFLQPANLNTVAEYLGYFMDTNFPPNPDRLNGPHVGTYNKDITPGIGEFVRWDAGHNPPGISAPPFGLPAGKLGYNWPVIQNCDTDYASTLAFYENEIDNGRPTVVSFDFWNPVDKGIAVVDPQTGETINVFTWGDFVSSSPPGNPAETWTYGDIGHAVTGVGYILNWDPDGGGPIPSADWVIVHDNWSTTPENVAIPWANWMCIWHINPNGP
jgi:hypothetical protein